MDHILKAKSQFKTASGTVGDAALLGSIGAAAAGADSRVAYGFLALGVVSKFFSHITKPDCDTRCWNNLPQCLSFAAFALPGGEHRLQIDFLDNSLQPIPRFTRVVTVQVRPEQECTVLFISDTVN